MNVRLELSDKKTHPQPHLSGLDILQREVAKILAKENPSLLKRGIFPKRDAFGKGEFFKSSPNVEKLTESVDIIVFIN